MPPPPPLSLGQFAQQQIEIQGLSVKQFARRAGLGLSHAYQILRGKRPNASAETYEAVARGLGMTLSEMLVAMGRGAPGDDPRRAVLHALLRNVPDEDLGTIERVVRPFVIPPVNKQPSNRRRAEPSNRPASIHSELEQVRAATRETDAHGGLSTVSHALLARLFPSFRRLAPAV